MGDAWAAPGSGKREGKPSGNRPRGRGRLRLAAVAVTVAVVGAPLAVATARTGDPVLLNELLVSHTGADTTEFFELYGTPGQPLAGLSLVVVEGDGSAAGTIDLRIDLPADAVLGGNGFFLVGNPVGLAANYGVAPDLALASSDLVENGSETVALVATSSIGAVGERVSGSEELRDAVGLSDGGTSDAWFWGAPALGPDPDGFFPAGASRLADGVDTDAAEDWRLADFSLASTTEPNTPTASTPYVAPTATPTPTPTATPTPAATPTPTPTATPAEDLPGGDGLAAVVEMLESGVAGGEVAPTKIALLRDRLARVDRFLADGQRAAARAQLRAFANQVRGLSPHWVAHDAAEALAAAAAGLAAELR